MAIQSTKVYEFSEDSPISGKVEVTVPLYSERLRLLSKLRFKVDKETNTIINNDDHGLDRLADSIDMVEKYIVKVDCEIRETKEKIETFHDLCLFSECQDVLLKASGDLVKGLTLGKK